MDALATTLMSIRLTSPLLARLTLGDNLSLSMNGATLHTRAIPFHYVLSGTCRLIADDLEFDLKPGDMIILPEARAHRLETGRASSKLDIVNLVQESRLPQWSLNDGLDSPLQLRAGDGVESAQLISGIFTAHGGQGGLTLKDLPACIHLRGVGEQLGGLMEAALDMVVAEHGARPGFAATSSRLLEAILTESLRVWVLTREHPPGLLRGLMDPVIAPLLGAINRDPGKSWTVVAMAEACGQSRSAFARDFRATLDISPAAFVTKVRCEHAERLIFESDMPIGKIASFLGYRSTFAFSRAFNSQRNLTPAALRRRKLPVELRSS
jgi:AraC-like DNA-binding protein/mannose-6-phosphate isomerase-like protein (cupin superfamily)